MDAISMSEDLISSVTGENYYQLEMHLNLAALNDTIICWEKNHRFLLGLEKPRLSRVLRHIQSAFFLKKHHRGLIH